MPGWYFDKKELKITPSIAQGLDFQTEMRYRKEGARFIIDTGMKMDLGYNTTATGVVYFHRFYMFHSFQQFPRYVTACCCLFLAGKVEETPKKCKDIIKIARALLTDQKFATFGVDPKEEVMTLERILLQTIKFDLQVEHPYQFLLKYAKCLKGDKAKLQKMVQMAWTFVNDSLCTTLCLQWEPEIIAVALMYLAGKLSKFEVVDWAGRSPKHLRWWDMFVEDITMDLLEDICHQVLDLYSKPAAKSPTDSPPPSSSSTTSMNKPPSPLNKQHANGNEKLQQISPDNVVAAAPSLLTARIPPSADVPFPYQTFTHAPPSLASAYGAVQFSAAHSINTPPNSLQQQQQQQQGATSHIPPPPPPNVYSAHNHSYVGHPQFSTIVPPPNGPPPFYGNGLGPHHRPFYAPPP